jgi:hypothetical protein
MEQSSAPLCLGGRRPTDELFGQGADFPERYVWACGIGEGREKAGTVDPKVSGSGKMRKKGTKRVEAGREVCEP